ncbi:hypothetical protein ACA29_00325 [Lederbergia galactosidilytica]|uniref:ABC transporter domain-containing protein n=1 Tax=Lederbergia galactosidilytica TaxID=217031 RepID=A0A0Q9Y8I6_9BACI|nr:hypothetical protein ACA29_00325 [Lederbergia galactosidilytica]
MIIEAQDISVKIGGRIVFEGESVSCKPGIMTALIGASGSGKTTLLHCLGLLLPVSKGSILINKNDVTKYGSAARREDFGEITWHSYCRIMALWMGNQLPLISQCKRVFLEGVS